MMSDPNTNAGLSSDAIESKFDRVDELVSLLVDELIEDDQFKELEALLVDDADLRSRYIQDIQLHCDLMDFFRTEAEPLPPSPVLSMLMPDNADSGIEVGIQPPKK